MRSTLAAAAAIAIAAVIMLFSSGPGSPSVAWADIREKVENATAMQYTQSTKLIGVDSQELKTLGGQSRVVLIDGVGSRFTMYSPEGEVANAVISNGNSSLHLSYRAEHAAMSTTRFIPRRDDQPEDRVDGAEPTTPLDMLIELSDKHAERVGEVELDGRPAVEFRIAMSALADFLLAQAVDASKEEAVKVESAFGGSLEAMRKLDPMRLWIDEATGLPVRMEMPLDPKPYGDSVQIPEGGRLVLVMESMRWNDDVDRDPISLRVPDGWALDRSESVILGGDLTPEDPRFDPAGVPLLDGVEFRLVDPAGEVIATQADVVGVTRVVQTTGHSKGKSGNEWDNRDAYLRFTDTVRERFNEVLAGRAAVTCRYELDGRFAGEVRIIRSTLPGEAAGQAVLDGIDIGDLTPDQFVDGYLSK